ncbi:MAG: Electron transfer domain protein [Paenibacillus sp.]|jgi:hypothetical protein|nr:Electron transfer domain protein [Paenibacillus sp.]
MKKFIKYSAVSVAVIVLLAGGWYLGSPVFINKTVQEELPVTAGKAEGKAEAAADTGPLGADTEKTGVTKPDKAAIAYSGAFVDGDSFHKVKGTAKTVEADGKTFLRLEDLDATNGPDLYVYLIKEGTKTNEGFNLGMLKGNKGSHNYELPEHADLTQYNQVVIYCKQFSVNFGSAILNAV